MTLRSLIIGLLGVVFIVVVGYYNDHVWRLTSFVGNHFPISVFGLLFFFLLTINPLLFLLGRKWRLSASELAVIVTLMLVACSVPGSGLLRSFTPCIAMPVRYYAADSGWQKAHLLPTYATTATQPAGVLTTQPYYMPEKLLPAGGNYYKKVEAGVYRDAPLQVSVVEDMWSGVRKGTDNISVDNVPWSQWTEALSFWVPLVFLISLCVICLSLIVHRQWAYRERLRYPIAEVAETLVRQDPDRGYGPIFRNKLFWIGLCVILVIHLLNGWYEINGGSTIQIPLKFDFTAVSQKYSSIGKVEGGNHLLSPQIFPTVVAFAFFLASDVGLSLGLSQVFFVSLLVFFTTSGIDISRNWMTGGVPDYQRFGSYLGVAILLAYMGRRYYWDMIKKAFVPTLKIEVEAISVWACRILIVASAALVWIMMSLGIDWPIAVLMVLVTLIMFLVMARISAESGLFFIQPWWHPVSVLVGLFGMTAFGPKALIVLGIIVMVMLIDPRESLMPFLVNGLKMCDDSKVSPKKAGPVAAVAFALALCLGVGVALWSSYNHGINTGDAWVVSNLAKMPYKEAQKWVDRLNDSGDLQKSETMPAWQRIVPQSWGGAMNSDPKFLWAAGIGVALVLITSFLRLRYTWWPLHPILFLIWGINPMWFFSGSFLLGWAIKTAVTRLGGGKTYRAMVPLMMGIIAGDLLGGLFWMGWGGYYYLTWGVAPTKMYKIFPG
jgi:hypothetical protein